MDPAIKSGFAIGFAVIAAAGGLYIWREGAVRPADRQAPALSEPAAPKAPSAVPNGAAPKDAPAAQAEPPATSGPPERKAEAEPPTPKQATPDEARKDAPALAESKPPEQAAEDARGEDAAKEKGGFDVVRVEPSGEMVVAGRCPSGCTAELTANGKTQDQAKADASGNFAMTPNALPPGDYELGLRVKTPDGQVKTSDQTVTVSVPAPPSKDVVVVLNEPNAPSKVLQKPDGQTPTAATEQKQAAAVAPVSPAPDAPISLGAVDAEKGRFFVQGSAPAGAKLKIYLNNAPIADARTGKDGRWSLKVEKGLAPGDYVMRVDRLSETDGKVTSRVETRFAYEPEVADAGPAASAPTPSAPKPAETGPSAQPNGDARAADAKSPPQVGAPEAPAAGSQDSAGQPGAVAQAPAPQSPAARPERQAEAAAPSASSQGEAAQGEAAQDKAARDKAAQDEANPVVASLDTVKVRRGDSLWRISRANYGQGMRYTIIFAANDSQIRDPDLIYPGQVLVVPPQKTGSAEAAGR